MSAINERLGPKHVNTGPCTVPRSEHAVGTAIRGYPLFPLMVEIHVDFLWAQLSSIDIRRIDSRLRGGYNELEDPPGARSIGDASREVEARRGETQSRQAAARLNWRPSDKPAWLNKKTYRRKIQPRLAEIAVPIISSTLGISKPHATDIHAGRRCPHPRHWLALAQLVGVGGGRSHRARFRDLLTQIILTRASARRPSSCSNTYGVGT